MEPNSKTLDLDISNCDNRNSDVNNLYTYNLNNASSGFYNYNVPNLDFPSPNVAVYDHSNVDILATEIYVETKDKMAVDANIYSAAARIGNLSATKAGISNGIQEKVAKVIYESSKDSEFYKNEVRKDELVNKKIEGILDSYTFLKSQDLSNDQVKVDKILENLALKRNYSRVIMHIDMDAFYASVEMRDNPSLKDIPMAVGDISMLCTANYVARKYGVRSAMPGFIAKRLCPTLVIVPLNFVKYREASSKIHKILKLYDPNLRSVGLDEAYLDITDYLDNTTITPDQLAQRIRSEIKNETGLIASAGIGPNLLLAKVCSDINKPNGQYDLSNLLEEEILEFVKSLEIRKIKGIGRVTGKILNALEVYKCNDILVKRVYLYKLLPQVSFNFLIRVALGIGPVNVGEKFVRKSMSFSRTFKDCNDKNALIKYLKTFSSNLAYDLATENLEGRIVILKYKETNFVSHTKNKKLPTYINTAEDIFNYSRKLLESLGDVNLRNLGVGLSDLRSRDFAEINGIKRCFIATSDFDRDRSKRQFTNFNSKSSHNSSSLSSIHVSTYNCNTDEPNQDSLSNPRTVDNQQGVIVRSRRQLTPNAKIKDQSRLEEKFYDIKKYFALSENNPSSNINLKNTFPTTSFSCSTSPISSPKSMFKLSDNDLVTPKNSYLTRYVPPNIPLFTSTSVPKSITDTISSNVASFQDSVKSYSSTFGDKENDEPNKNMLVKDKLDDHEQYFATENFFEVEDNGILMLEIFEVGQDTSKIIVESVASPEHNIESGSIRALDNLEVKTDDAHETDQNNNSIGNKFTDIIPISDQNSEIKNLRKDWICPWCDLKFRDLVMVFKRKHFKSCSKLKNKTKKSIRNNNSNQYSKNRSNHNYR
ncbi:3403_t:CDS:10 [Entrophospora sp. SA101]|nr:3403_t:CDS:10 [Entrophospora sp. SA101]CAJ0825011.1 9814_t:CDS:10 [Entrophospora sp. SA101]